MYEKVLEVTPFGQKVLKDYMLNEKMVTQIQTENMIYENFIYWLNETMGIMVT